MVGTLIERRTGNVPMKPVWVNVPDHNLWKDKRTLPGGGVSVLAPFSGGI